MRSVAESIIFKPFGVSETESYSAITVSEVTLVTANAVPFIQRGQVFPVVLFQGNFGELVLVLS